ncbi:lipid-A-disaccharide synthase N-terminal domain-containing protein [Parachlamydia acanthamoebae]
MKKRAFFWHCLGTIGLALFASRFWIQWWCAEKQQKKLFRTLILVVKCCW